MANLLQPNQISNVVPNWQHPVLPPRAVQGSLLVTTTDFVNPPQSASNFTWLPMEDIVGVHDIRLDYDETKNLYTILKAYGHLNNDGKWATDWYSIGTIQGITEEVQEGLKALVYVSYDYDTSVANNLTVSGIKKDGTKVQLCSIQFVDSTEFNKAINNLTTLCNNLQEQVTKNKLATSDTVSIDSTGTNTKANVKTPVGSGLVSDSNGLYINVDKGLIVDSSNKLNVKTDAETLGFDSDGKLYVTDKAGKYNNGTATTIDETARIINVNVDDSTIKVNDDNELTVPLIDDTNVSSDKTWSSAKIKNQSISAFTYKGRVNTYSDLPSTASVGDTYQVIANQTYYSWNGSEWDVNGTQFVAGSGINITGNVISASGVAFGTGNGLQITGSGSSATMSVYPNPNGALSFNTEKQIHVNTGDTTEISSANNIEVKYDTTKGITKNSNGVAVNTDDITIKSNSEGKLEAQLDSGLIKTTNGIALNPDNESLEVSTVNNMLEAKLNPNGGIEKDSDGLMVATSDGLTVDSSGVKINANFDISTKSLGSDSSNIIKYADDKIGIDKKSLLGFELIYDGKERVYTIPNFEKYAMFWVFLNQDSTAIFPNTPISFNVMGGYEAGGHCVICNKIQLDSDGVFTWTNLYQTVGSFSYNNLKIYGIK